MTDEANPPMRSSNIFKWRRLELMLPLQFNEKLDLWLISYGIEIE
jgi:hypothetical protein